MAEEGITKEDLTKLEENLGRMIAKGFDENTEQHQRIFERFEKIDERFGKIDERFNHVNARLDIIDQDLKEIKEETVRTDNFEDLKARVEVLEKKSGVVS